MLQLLKRRVKNSWIKAPWATLGVMIGSLYVAGYLMMRWAEPATNPIRSLPTYTYFFIVTVTTVGYGDVVPVTVGRPSDCRHNRDRRHWRSRGRLGEDLHFHRRITSSGGKRAWLRFDMKDHIVIFGNRGAETAALIRQLIADRQSSGTEIVLCSYATERNPFPDFIDFVRGELTSTDVMTRACVKDAGKVIIHAGTDYESISIALAVKEINHKAPIVVRANDPGKEVDIERVDRKRVVCIPTIDVPMMIREIHNPGITQVIEKLLSPDGQDLRSIRVPEGGHSFRFGPLAHAFREQYGAILIGMRPAGNSVNAGAILNPAFNAVVEGGMFLDYIARDAVEIDWAE